MRRNSEGFFPAMPANRTGCDGAGMMLSRNADERWVRDPVISDRGGFREASGSSDRERIGGVIRTHTNSTTIQSLPFARSLVFEPFDCPSWLHIPSGLETDLPFLEFL